MRISHAKQLLHKKAGSPLYWDPTFLLLEYYFFIFVYFIDSLILSKNS